MDKEGIQRVLSDRPGMRSKLFARGFLLTDAPINEQSYPFYGAWSVVPFEEYKVFTAPNMSCYVQFGKGIAIALIGHAYDPFDLQYNEKDILTNLLIQLQFGERRFWDSINKLTGVFTIIVQQNNELVIIGDASGMQTTFYAVQNGNRFVSSHTNLLGDLLNLTWDPYVRELSRYRFFKLLGNSLPGDLTQFSEVKRLVPNHYVRIDKDGNISANRFYWPVKLVKSRHQIADEVAQLIHASLELIAEKWSKPAISLTGGCDSKTTLACANGLYERFSYFSYISSEAEAVDAEAASQICSTLGLEHIIYSIPEKDCELPDIDAAKEMLNWNTGNILYSHPNDVRKRVFFADVKDFDVEVKSWASEIGRAYYSKRFHGRADFGENPTPRKCTTLYKFFFHNRKLVKETDAVFADYLKRYFDRAAQNPVEWQEQFFWEFRVPSWNGLVITGEHRYSFDITIPYNNRRLLELLLSVPIEDRIHDNVYKEIREKMNDRIDATGIAVTNLKHTGRREMAENLYYSMHSKVLF